MKSFEILHKLRNQTKRDSYLKRSLTKKNKGRIIIIKKKERIKGVMDSDLFLHHGRSPAVWGLQRFL